MNAVWAEYLLYSNLVAHSVLIAGALWSIWFPALRIYPMSGKNLWYYLMWTLFGFVFLSNPAFVVLDWGTGLWTSALRFWIAIPVAVSGLAFVTWGIATLGVKNTSALRDRFVAAGPYLVSRNPQYVGDIFLFLGVIILANSQVVLVTHLLTSFVFLLAPFAEEPWLEDEYGGTYIQYRREVSRFL